MSSNYRLLDLPRVLKADNTMSEYWSVLCNFYSKMFFFFFFFFFYSLSFLFSLLNFNYDSIVKDSIVKISECLNKRNLLKTCLQFTYPTNFCIISSHFMMENKSENIDYLKPVNKIMFFFF